MTKQFNSSFATFYSKHMIRCYGVQHHLHNIDPSIPDKCPCCKSPNKTTAHIVLCSNNDRSTLYEKFVSDLVKWMNAIETSPVLIGMIRQYLKARNTMSMVEVLVKVEYNPLESQLLLAEDHDKLGWQNFIEGEISKRYVEMQNAYYRSLEKCKRSAKVWARSLIENLIQIIHNQWTWRNEKLHYQRHPGAGRRLHLSMSKLWNALLTNLK